MIVIKTIFFVLETFENFKRDIAEYKPSTLYDRNQQNSDKSFQRQTIYIGMMLVEVMPLAISRSKGIKKLYANERIMYEWMESCMWIEEEI